MEKLSDKELDSYYIKNVKYKKEYPSVPLDHYNDLIYNNLLRTQVRNTFRQMRFNRIQRQIRQRQRMLDQQQIQRIRSLRNFSITIKNGNSQATIYMRTNHDGFSIGADFQGGGFINVNKKFGEPIQ